MVDVKLLRQQQSLKQSQIATILGCSQVHVSYIENGTRNITAQQYSRLVEHFGQETLDKYDTDSESYIGTNTNEQEKTPTISNEDLLELLKEQSKQISKFQEQIDVLLNILSQKG